MRLTEKGREELQELTWRLVDDEIDEPGFRRLESVLRDSEEGRQVYVDCVWLHSELVWYFRHERGDATSVKIANDELLRQILESKSPDPLPPSIHTEPVEPKKRKRRGLLSIFF